MLASKNNNSTLVTLCVIAFVISLGESVIYPILPELFLDQHIGLLIGASEHTANIFYGLTLSAFFFTNMLSAPLFGGLSDTYGRRLMMIVGLMITFLSYTFSILAIAGVSMALFIFARCLMGGCSGAGVVGLAMVGDMTDSEDERLNLLRWIILASLSGVILGPLLATTAMLAKGRLSLAIPFTVGAVMACLCVLIAKKYLPKMQQSPSGEVKAKLNFKKIVTIFKDLFRVLARYQIRRLVLSFACLQFGLGLYMQSLSLFLAEYFDYHVGEIGFFYIVMTIASIMNVMVLQPYIQRNFSLSTKGIAQVGTTALLTALLIQLISVYILFNHADHTALLVITYISSLLIYLFFSLSYNATIVLFSSSVSSSEQGINMGSVELVVNVCMFAAGLLVGYIVLHHEFILLTICASFVFVSMLFMHKYQPLTLNEVSE
ncbi:MAG: MFS transporter [Pseudomonadota bacterium]